MGITWGSSPSPYFLCKVFEAGDLGLDLSLFACGFKQQHPAWPGGDMFLSLFY
jgi:hypothetical protein